MNTDINTIMPPEDESLIQEELADQVGEANDLAAYSPFRVDAKEMDEAAWENFLGQVDILPESRKEPFFNPDTINLLYDAAEKFDLSEDQIKNLSRIVRDTLLGNLEIDDLASNISGHLDLPPDKSSAIANSLASEIFKSKPSVKPSVGLIPPKPPERPDLKIGPDINKNNVVDLRKNNP